MIFIYNCYGGTHTSSLASEIHLKRLPADRLPTKDEILGAKYFNKLNSKDMGKFFYRGTDDEGHKVFTLGRGMSKALLPCVVNLLNMMHDEYGVKEKFVLSNLSPTVPPAMSIGGYLSRQMGVDFLGVPLLVSGTNQAYWKIVDIVKRTKEKANSFNEGVLLLNNEDKQFRL